MSDTGTLTSTPLTGIERARGRPRGLAVPAWLAFWRSPSGQPRWARPVLLGIATLAAVVYARNIGNSGYATYYSIAVKSMSVSWKAFFFGALDPGATITIDKLAGSFVPQALSARLFGYHQWSLTLPQVIEGVVSVLAMYRLVRRWSGAVAGTLAAGVFALTPILASMFGHPMEDGALTMCLVLAADAFILALTRARLRSLLLAGVWVGLGFQAKMLQAWMVLPALGLTYLFAAPTSWRRRLAHLGLAGIVTVAVSLSWILLYTLTPAQHRPYVDGSTNNNAFSMVFGYNGLDRFGITIPGSVRSMFAGGGGSGGGLPSDSGLPSGGGWIGGQPGAGFGSRASGGFDQQGWTKLLSDGYASQIGWLYPLALLALVLGLIWYRRTPHAPALPGQDGPAPSRAGFLLWGLWLATYAAVFSRITIPHTAYLASLAPPLAALSGAGIVLLWRAYHERRTAWLLPFAIALQVAWTGYLARRYATFLPWLTWSAVGVAAVCTLVLAAGAVRIRLPRRAASAAMVLGVAAVLAVPSAWALSVLDPAYAGSAFDASAGPGGVRAGGAGTSPRSFGPGGGFPGGQPAAPGDASAGDGTGTSGDGTNGSGPIQGGDLAQGNGLAQGGGPMMRGGTGNQAPGGESGDTLTAAQQRLDAYLLAHRDGARYVAATTSWQTAGAYIIATGQPFLPMGGFSGSVPQPTLDEVQRMVAARQLRYVLLGDRGGFARGGDDRGDGTVSRISSWVTSACTAVPATEYGGDGTQELYRCGN